MSYIHYSLLSKKKKILDKKGSHRQFHKNILRGTKIMSKPVLFLAKAAAKKRYATSL